MNQQRLRLYLKLSDEGFGESDEREAVYALEDELDEMLSSNNAGACDGHEFGQGYAKVFLAGENADEMFTLIINHVRSFNPRAGSYIIKRYDELGEREDRIDL